MIDRTRRNGYRGEPSRTKYKPLLPKQRLCLIRIDGKLCLEPRNHKGDHRS